MLWAQNVKTYSIAQEGVLGMAAKPQIRQANTDATTPTRPGDAKSRSMCEASYRPFVATLLTTPDITLEPEQPDAPARPFLAPLLVLVAWGSDPAHATVATRTGAICAAERGFKLRDSLTSYGGPMRAAPLVDVAETTFFRRGATYDRAWWLVSHSAISPSTMERARRALQQQWNEEAARAGEFKHPRE